MTLRILSVSHDQHGLSEVQRLSRCADSLSASLRDTHGVEGFLTLATCNRLEFVIHAPRVSETHLRHRLAGCLSSPPEWKVYEENEALNHLFRVAAGLASMVVGEREIAGQLRRALKAASQAGHVSGTLMAVVNAALHTARRIGSDTRLQDSGRSVVSVGLDMTGIEQWTKQRVLLVGTGSYAGAVVATLRQRGAEDILVHSTSGRARDFAARHDIRPTEDLTQALTWADLVITCRGGATPVITREQLEGSAPKALLDLSLQPDVERSVATLPGMTLLDLGAIQNAISPTWAADSARAERIVAEGVSEIAGRLASRVADPAVASLRASMLQIVDDEVARLPQGRALTVEDCALALRRLTTRLLHTPSTRARDAASEGRIDDYLDAMEELYGIAARRENEAPVVPGRCPVTGLSFADLQRDASLQSNTTENR
ncbi:MAG: glutamyl-tRNA reductase [Actinomycetaceae bacterium]|nr:glutamyl-tRNA reductase [Actinomycetaceae bacterium]